MEPKRQNFGSNNVHAPDIYGKTYPQAVDLEEAVLGACLIESGKVKFIVEFLSKGSFYKDSNKIIFSAMEKMYEEGMQVDLLTIEDFLRKTNRLEEIGGIFKLTKITNQVVSSAHIETHARILIEKQIQREKIKLGAKILDEGYNNADLEHHKETIDKLERLYIGGLWKGIGFQTKEAYIDMMKGVTNYYTSGMIIYDKQNNGFAKGDLVILAARPSVGKSALMATMAINMAKRNLKIGIISLEMTQVQLTKRMFAICSEFSLNAINNNFYGEKEKSQEMHRRLQDSFFKYEIMIDDRPNQNIRNISSNAQRLKKDLSLDILFIDYLQLIEIEKGMNRQYNRTNEITDLSRKLKIMAKELDIPVIVLCQLNRDIDRRANNKYPLLSDLRESGSIEQDADIVIMLHSNFMSGKKEDENGESTEDKINVFVRKARNGKRFDFEMKYVSEFTKFYDIKTEINTAKNFKEIQSPF